MTKNKKPTKDKFIKLRVSEAERNSWNAKAQALGVTLADYFRMLANEEPTEIKRSDSNKRRKYTPADPELVRQIARIGNNLNQIAKAVNQGYSTDLLEQLITIERMLKGVIDAH